MLAAPLFHPPKFFVLLVLRAKLPLLDVCWLRFHVSLICSEIARAWLPHPNGLTFVLGLTGEDMLPCSPPPSSNFVTPLRPVPSAIHANAVESGFSLGPLESQGRFPGHSPLSPILFLRVRKASAPLFYPNQSPKPPVFFPLLDPVPPFSPLEPGACSLKTKPQFSHSVIPPLSFFLFKDIVVRLIYSLLAFFQFPQNLFAPSASGTISRPDSCLLTGTVLPPLFSPPPLLLL